MITRTDRVIADEACVLEMGESPLSAPPPNSRTTGG